MGRMERNDHAAIRAVLSGDKNAYGALVAQHSRAVFRVAFRITDNEADAEEVVQDAFLRGYRKLADFESRSNFGTWIYRIAVRCALDRIERRNGEAARANIAADAEPEAVQILVNPHETFLVNVPGIFGTMDQVQSQTQHLAVVAVDQFLERETDRKSVV